MFWIFHLPFLSIDLSLKYLINSMSITFGEGNKEKNIRKIYIYTEKNIRKIRDNKDRY